MSSADIKVPGSVASNVKPKRKKQWTRVGVPPHVCVVCGDGAYGYNFGQITCESCKAFFRRHINKPRDYVCPGDRQCNVSCKTRKYCPACRLRKCFDVGLKPDIARITNQLREEKKAAKKHPGSVRVKRDESFSESDSDTVQPSDAKRSCKQELIADECEFKVQTAPQSGSRGSQKHAGVSAAPIEPPGSNSRLVESGSPQLDAFSTPSPLLIGSPASGACETPASSHSWCGSIPSVPLSTVQCADAQSSCTDGNADEQTSTRPGLNGCEDSAYVRASQSNSPTLALSKYCLPDDEFACMRTVCNTLIMAMQAPYSDAECTFLRSKLPETMYEMMSVAETAMRRFVRFAKQLPHFRDNFSFDEKVVILRRAVLTCHMFSFSFGFDVETRERIIRLSDGTDRIITGAHIAELKRRAGLPDNTDPRPAYIELQIAVRTRFPRTWRMMVAAFALTALFTPTFHLRKLPRRAASESDPPSVFPRRNRAPANLSCLNLEQETPVASPKSDCTERCAAQGAFGDFEETHVVDATAAHLANKLKPFYRRFKAFIPRYIEYMEKVRLSETERRSLVRFCKEHVAKAHAIATDVTGRVGLLAAFDPDSTQSLIPLYNELLDN